MGGAGHRRDALDALELGQREEAQEGQLFALDARVRATLDGLTRRELRLNDQLNALEASISDQRHALQRMVSTFDANAYSQRLEFQRRLADLMNNMVDQRQELHGQLAAIEAGLSDQRISLMRLGSTLVPGGSGEWAAAEDAVAAATATAQEAAPPDASALEQKLGIMLDCMLADHVSTMARQGLEAGELQQDAYDELVKGLDDLKLERLRDRHQPYGEEEPPGSAGDGGEDR